MALYTNLTYLKEITDDDEELIAQSLQRYLVTSPAQLDKLMQGTVAMNWGEIHDNAHSLFATTQIVGIVSLAQELKDVQNLAREEKNYDLIKEKVERIHEIILISHTEVKEHLERISNT